MKLEIKNKYLELYNLSLDIYDLKPWEYLWDDDLSCIILDNNDLFYISVLGRGGNYKGIVILTENKINRYLLTASNTFHPLQLLNYQEGIMIGYINPKDLRADEKVIPNELNIRFYDIAITIKKYQKGFFPYDIDIDKLNLYIDILYNFKALLKHVTNKEINLTKGNMLLRMPFDKGGYKNTQIELSLPEEEIKAIDCYSIEDILNLSRNDDILELDFNNYLPISLGSNYIEKLKTYKLPFYYAIASFKDEKILKFEIINENDYKNVYDYYHFIINELINTIKANGHLPKTIIVRDKYIKELLNNISIDLNIEIKVSKLTNIDSLIDMVIHQNKNLKK